MESPAGTCMYAAGVKNAAELIKAQSRIIELESEVNVLRQEAVTEKLKQDFSFITKDAAAVTDSNVIERQHQVRAYRSSTLD